MATAETSFAVPSVVTAKDEALAVMEESDSSYVRTTLVPSVLVAAETKVGGVPATLELLVTKLAAKEATSFPVESWMTLASSPGVRSE